MQSISSSDQVYLVTGAARRIGAEISRALHARGHRVLVHCRRSMDEAERLTAELNAKRPDSARILAADLADLAALNRLVDQVNECWGRLDGLINNASVFYPTPLGESEAHFWDEVIGVNLRAPYVLSEALLPLLRAVKGSIVNVADVYGERPLHGYPIYSIAKAGLLGLTRVLAHEMAPDVRVNAVSPGAILWHEHPIEPSEKQRVLERIPMGGLGKPSDIARTVTFLLLEAPYVTGQVIAVDGGRSLTI